MEQSVVDPWGEEPFVFYPPARRLRQLVSEPRPPYCSCPRVVRTDGTVKVWHGPGCREVMGEELAAIL